MFTGIVEELGIINSIKNKKINIKTTLDGIELGDSIAVNGVCFTVSSFETGGINADISDETLRKTAPLKVGQRVNLERALTLNKRLGGHIVSGHIDGTGRIRYIKGETYCIGVSPDLHRYMVLKGSVAIDGVSLTISELGAGSFCVSVIPHTLTATTLNTKRESDIVNIECDVLGKYVEKFILLK